MNGKSPSVESLHKLTDKKSAMQETYKIFLNRSSFNFYAAEIAKKALYFILCKHYG